MEQAHSKCEERKAIIRYSGHWKTCGSKISVGSLNTGKILMTKNMGKKESIWGKNSSRHSMKSELGVAITTSKSQGIKTRRLYHSLRSQCDMVAVPVMGWWEIHLLWVVQGPLTPFANVVIICKWLPRWPQKGVSGLDMGTSQESSLIVLWIISVHCPAQSGSPRLTAGNLGEWCLSESKCTQLDSALLLLMQSYEGN